MLGDFHHSHIVGSPLHDGPPVGQHFLEGDYFARGLHIASGYDVERLVQQHFHPPPEGADLLETGCDAHLAAAAIDIHCLVFVDGQHGGVFGWRLAQLLQVVSQRHHLLSHFAEGVVELLVARAEVFHLGGERVIALAQVGDLFACGPQLLVTLLDRRAFLNAAGFGGFCLGGRWGFRRGSRLGGASLGSSSIRRVRQAFGRRSLAILLSSLRHRLLLVFRHYPVLRLFWHFIGFCCSYADRRDISAKRVSGAAGRLKQFARK